jgi:hypothetical protein
MSHGCPREAPTAVEGPDPLGRFAIVCLGCGLVLDVADDREELYADL